MLALGALLVHAAAAITIELKLDTFHPGSLEEGGSSLFRLWLALPSDLKVVLLPLKGDPRVVISLDENATAEPSWTLNSDGGLEELLLRRDVLPVPCFLYLRLSAYSQTAFRIGVLNALDPFSTSGEPCAPDCAPAMLANEACDLLCNTTRCAFDRGTCLTELDKQCSPGCSGEWLEDGGACRVAAPRSIGWVAACCSLHPRCADLRVRACVPVRARATSALRSLRRGVLHGGMWVGCRGLRGERSR